MDREFHSFEEIKNNFSSWKYERKDPIYFGKRVPTVLWSLEFEDEQREKHWVTVRGKEGIMTIEGVRDVQESRT